MRHGPPFVLRRYPVVAPGRQHVRVTDVAGAFGQKLAPLRAVLRKGGQFSEGERGAVRAREAEVLEMELKGPALGHLLATVNLFTGM